MVESATYVKHYTGWLVYLECWPHVSGFGTTKEEAIANLSEDLTYMAMIYLHKKW